MLEEPSFVMATKIVIYESGKSPINGPLWEWLPEGALHNDPNAYSKSERASTASSSLHQLPQKPLVAVARPLRCWNPVSFLAWNRNPGGRVGER
jgi:hypothetical protein